MKKKVKTNIQLMKEVRKQWSINPRTRVQEDKRLNIKKIREEGKKRVNEEI